jgi:hypothetical protein
MRIIISIMVITGCIFLSNYCFAQTSSELIRQSDLPQQQEKTIFDFKKEVGLTDDQENKLKAILFDSQSLVNSRKVVLNILGAELGQMIGKKEEMKLIKGKLTEISKIQVEITCAGIESGRKINSILTSEQVKKWEEIRKAYLKK